MTAGNYRLWVASNTHMNGLWQRYVLSECFQLLLFYLSRYIPEKGKINEEN